MILSPFELTVASSAGVVSTRTRPPPTGAGRAPSSAGRELHVRGEVLSCGAEQHRLVISGRLGTSRVECQVSRLASPPVAGMTNTSKLPYLSEAKATDWPS
jgi:hypothetical protein